MEKSGTLQRLDLPPVWGAAAWVAIIVWSGRVDAIAAPSWLAELGSGITAAGVALALWAVWQFMGVETPVEAGRTARVLLRTGPYRYVRHPIYLGLAVATTGFALANGELTALVFAGGFVWVLQNRFVLPEEAMLEEQFGDEFRTYAAEVKRRMW